jgi:hypothetical protein
MFFIPESSPSVERFAAYCTILELLNEVEFAAVEERADGVITVRMLTEPETLIFDIVRDATPDLDRISVVMVEGESEPHYGYKLLQRVIAAFVQKNIQLTMSDRVKTFLDLYEGLKGENPTMNEDYRSIFPGLSFWAGIQLGMVDRDEKLEDTWRFV